MVVEDVDRDSDFLLLLVEGGLVTLLSVRLWRYANSEDGVLAWANLLVVRAPSDRVLFKFGGLYSGYLVLALVETTLLCPDGALDLDLDNVDLALVSASAPERERDRDKAGRGMTDRIVAISGLGTRGDWDG